jgi:hypothetical protein
MSDQSPTEPQVTKEANLIQDVLAEVIAILRDLPGVESDDKMRLAKLHLLLTGDKTTSHST